MRKKLIPTSRMYGEEIEEKPTVFDTTIWGHMNGSYLHVRRRNKIKIVRIENWE